MRKPRIIILTHYMELGGVETSLVGLLQALDFNSVDVDLFLHAHRGEMMAFIPNHINLIPEIPAYSVILRPLSEAILRGELGVAWGRIVAKMKYRRHCRERGSIGISDASVFQYVADSVARYLPQINPEVEYDLCISYQSPHSYALNKVRARRKLAWIHTDYSKVYVNREQELPIWGGFDAIASISDDVTREFVSVFPSLKDKIIGIENILSADFIRRRADEFEVSDFSA